MSSFKIWKSGSITQWSHKNHSTSHSLMSCQQAIPMTHSYPINMNSTYLLTLISMVKWKANKWTNLYSLININTSNIKWMSSDMWRKKRWINQWFLKKNMDFHNSVIPNKTAWTNPCYPKRNTISIRLETIRKNPRTNQ